MSAYTYFLDLAAEVEPPADGILSRTVFQDDRVKAIVFGFGPDPERGRSSNLHVVDQQVDP